MTKAYQIVDIFYGIVDGELRFPVEHMVHEDGVYKFPTRIVPEKPKIEITSRLIDVIYRDEDNSHAPEYDTWVFATEVALSGDYLTTSSYLTAGCGLTKNICRKLKSIQRHMSLGTAPEFSDIRHGTSDLREIWSVVISYVNGRLVINRNNDSFGRRNDILNGLWFRLDVGHDIVGIRLVNPTLDVVGIWDNFDQEVYAQHRVLGPVLKYCLETTKPEYVQNTLTSVEDMF